MYDTHATSWLRQVLCWLAFLGSFSTGLYAQYPAGLEIDGDIWATESQSDLSNRSTARADWFSQGSVSEAIFPQRAGYSRRGHVISRPFELEMIPPIRSIKDGYKVLDGVYANDPVWMDYTQLAAGANLFEPGTWENAANSRVQATQLQAYMLHMRRDGFTNQSDLWLTGGVIAFDEKGISHLDIELFRSDVVPKMQDGAGTMHTDWKFGANGQVVQVGDVLLSLDRAQSMDSLAVKCWIYVSASLLQDQFPQVLNARAIPFQFTGASYLSPDQNWAYAEIIPNSAKETFRSRTSDNYQPAPVWGVWHAQADPPQSLIVPGQFQEFALNLSSWGLDVNRYSGICQQVFGSVLVKTRTSDQLFAGPIDYARPAAFGQMVEMILDVAVQDLSCKADEVRPSVDYNDPLGGQFRWTGPKGFQSFAPSPTFQLTGQYIVSATSGHSCEVRDTLLVKRDLRVPDVTFTGGDITCQQAEVVLRAIDTTRATYSTWVLNRGARRLRQDSLLVTQPGSYEVLVEDVKNGCRTVASHKVTLDTLAPVISVPAYTLSCNTKRLAIEAHVKRAQNWNLEWKGPQQFVSHSTRPIIERAGHYTVKVTNRYTGCSAEETFLVRGNYERAGLEYTTDTLTCAIPQASIHTDIYSDSAYELLWEGPNGFRSTDPSPLVTSPGNYILAIKTLHSGCIHEAVVPVPGDILPPQLTIPPAPLISCRDSQVILSVFSDVSTAEYDWTGPDGFVSQQAKPLVSDSGMYQVSVKSPISGCQSDTFLYVRKDLTQPQLSMVKSGDLSCAFPRQLLFSGLANGPFSYDWHLPNGGRSFQGVLSIGDSGLYHLTATHIISGCQDHDSIRVAMFKRYPKVDLAQPERVSCLIKTRELELVADDSAQYTFSWSGPNGFVSQDLTPIAPVPGTYTVVVRDPGNGCDTLVSTILEGFNTAPALALKDGVLGCQNDSIQLDLVVLEPRTLEFSWIGPGGFVDSVALPTVGVAGMYEVAVVEPGTGCLGSDSLIITSQKQVPWVDIWANSLGCQGSTTEMTVQFTTGGAYRFDWTGPNKFVNTAPTFTVSEPGKYKLTLTDTISNCYTTDSINIVRNTIPPVLSLSKTGDLSPSVAEVRLLGFSNAQSPQFDWTGPNGFATSEAFPFVSDSGTYTLTITDGIRKCSTTDSIAVIRLPNRVGDPLLEGISLFPNPTTGLSQLELVVEESGHLKVEVYELATQKLIAVPVSRSVQQDEQLITRIDGAAWASGAYIIRISLNGRLVARKSWLILP